jgi:hypothetical protein
MESSATTTPVSTPMTSLSLDVSEIEYKLHDLQKYIALGCLHFNHHLPLEAKEPNTQWAELIFSDLPEEVRVLIGNEASRLLEARWIRLFLHRTGDFTASSLVRVYLLPEDWGRKYIDRNSKSLKTALRTLLLRIDVSSKAWAGHGSTMTRAYFDPWASAENVSLFYLFNKLPSPAPAWEQIKSRFSRQAVEDILDSMAFDPLNATEDSPLPGLKSRLHPYQARSASLMIQREASPQLQLDPRFDVRQSPNGEPFYFGAKDGSFVKEPKYYEANRGGILAETMVSSLDFLELIAAQCSIMRICPRIFC